MKGPMAFLVLLLCAAATARPRPMLLLCMEEPGARERNRRVIAEECQRIAEYANSSETCPGVQMTVLSGADASPKAVDRWCGEHPAKCPRGMLTFIVGHEAVMSRPGDHRLASG